MAEQRGSLALGCLILGACLVAMVAGCPDGDSGIYNPEEEREERRKPPRERPRPRGR